MSLLDDGPLPEDELLEEVALFRERARALLNDAYDWFAEMDGIDPAWLAARIGREEAWVLDRLTGAAPLEIADMVLLAAGLDCDWDHILRFGDVPDCFCPVCRAARAHEQATAIVDLHHVRPEGSC